MRAACDCSQELSTLRRYVAVLVCESDPTGTWFLLDVSAAACKIENDFDT